MFKIEQVQSKTKEFKSFIIRNINFQKSLIENPSLDEIEQIMHLMQYRDTNECHGKPV